ncbi:MAG: hypothetical protein DWQ47_12275 [Acidobacteria bacterium]|nr:MAG: hypothetical protein DWQ32_14690 [Acidobacteriota bacterium]REJ98345.1 MAG: hypothetical protein DWQ38_17490 [Acidobacteriota bacterium]REK17089.1 MAG: hypothetical protein DWQ43_02535 [Acidobacteriota bacterium]REK42999.1 MAG: hypothetical protein DWQ47_12275 [Acidobacteriota bacterium]
MSLFYQTVLLFSLNLIDAFLTVYWVRNGYATEGNYLMATLLEMGNLPFILVKVAIGVVAAYSFWNWKHFKLARFGLSISLVLYIGVMAIHFLTGLVVTGMVSGAFIQELNSWTRSVLIFSHQIAAHTIS